MATELWTSPRGQDKSFNGIPRGRKINDKNFHNPILFVKQDRVCPGKAGAEGCMSQAYWKCNFPMTLSDRLSVGSLVG